MSSDAPCPFCEPDEALVFHRGELVLGLWDAFPVSEGHALLVTRRHLATWFDATRDEQAELTVALELAREAVLARHQPDGFNIGVNIGRAAGQTVPHLHVHLIPRYLDDVEDPRGGVRHVIPARARYRLADRVAERSTLYGSPLVGGEADPLLPHILGHLDRAERADLLAAFVLESGVRLLQEHLRDLLDREGRVRLLTGDTLAITGLPRRSLGEGGSPTLSCAFSTCSRAPREVSTSASSSRTAAASIRRRISSTAPLPSPTWEART